MTWVIGTHASLTGTFLCCRLHVLLYVPHYTGTLNLSEGTHGVLPVLQYRRAGLVCFALLCFGGMPVTKLAKERAKVKMGAERTTGSSPEKMNLSHLHKTIMYEVAGAPAHRSLGL